MEAAAHLEESKSGFSSSMKELFSELRAPMKRPPDLKRPVHFDRKDPRFSEPLVAGAGMLPDKEAYRNIFSFPVYTGVPNAPYAPDGIPGALYSCFMREGVADALVPISANLRKLGCAIYAWDGFRPYEVQDHLHKQYCTVLVDQYGLDFKEASKIASTHVLPPGRKARHSYGGTIDLTVVSLSQGLWNALDCLADLIRKESNPETRLVYDWYRQELASQHGDFLPTGHVYDNVICDPKGRDTTNAYYYEDILAQEGRLSESGTLGLLSRRFIAAHMAAGGFHVYEDEVEQFTRDCKTTFNDVTFFYGPAELSEANRAHERLLSEFNENLAMIRKNPAEWNGVLSGLVFLGEERPSDRGSLRKLIIIAQHFPIEP